MEYVATGIRYWIVGISLATLMGVGFHYVFGQPFLVSVMLCYAGWTLADCIRYARNSRD